MYTQGTAPSSVSQTVAPIIHQATLWFLVSMVFVWGIIAGTSVLDCTDCMRQTRWKLYQGKNRMQMVGNYLEVF
jgi:hypothetical protein